MKRTDHRSAAAMPPLKTTAAMPRLRDGMAAAKRISGGMAAALQLVEQVERHRPELDHRSAAAMPPLKTTAAMPRLRDGMAVAKKISGGMAAALQL